MSATVDLAADRISADQLAAQLGLWDTGRGPLYHQLASAIGTLVDTGRLRNGVILPPERALAATLEVARGTVVSAYAKLAERGVVSRLQGSGTRVTTTRAATPEPVDRVGDALIEIHPDAIDLLKAVPRMLPRVLDVIRAIDLGDHASLLDEIDIAGLFPVRERVAKLVTAERLPTTADQVLITAGAQQALALTLQLLVRPGDVVVCEEATWPGLLDTVTGLGGRLRPVRLDHQGIVIDDLRRALVEEQPVAVVVSPSFHNPTGTLLPPVRREQLLALVDEFDVVLVEDRVTARLAIGGEAPAPLLADAGPAVVARGVVVDSLSKVAWPGSRIGWLRADAQFVEEARRVRFLVDQYTGIHSQLSLMGIIDHLPAIAADRIEQVRTARDALLDGIAEALPTWSVRRPRGGLVLWVELPGIGAESFCRHAARHGVLVASGRQFGVDDDRHLRIPYTATVPQLREAVRRLAAAWATFVPPPDDTARDRTTI